MGKMHVYIIYPRCIHPFSYKNRDYISSPVGYLMQDFVYIYIYIYIYDLKANSL